jgi:hypothetical protein
MWSHARAGIVLNPSSNATVIYAGASAANFDLEQDGAYRLMANGRYGGGTGAAFQSSLYGANINNLWVAENGNLNFGTTGDGGFYSFPLSSSNAALRVSPFGDDVFMLDGLDNKILDHSVAGSYLAITWQDIRLFNDVPAGGPVPMETMTTQVIWFEKDMQIQGFDFKKDDIAFGYSGFSGGTIDATIGVGKDANVFTPIPGDADGLISSTQNQSNLIPWGDKEFLLFRPQAGGASYLGTRESFTAVPEPSSLLMALSAGGLVLTKWRRKFLGQLVRKRHV